jgi:hypothetical protein
MSAQETINAKTVTATATQSRRLSEASVNWLYASVVNVRAVAEEVIEPVEEATPIMVPEALMPKKQSHVNRKTRLQTLGLILSSILIVSVYTIIPLTMVAYSLVRNEFIDVLYALLAWAGIIMVISGILVATSSNKYEARRKPIANWGREAEELQFLHLQMEDGNV